MGPARWPAIRKGLSPTRRAARIWAKRRPPSSRAIRPVTKTVDAKASAGKRRSPSRESPKSTARGPPGRPSRRADRRSSRRGVARPRGSRARHDGSRCARRRRAAAPERRRSAPAAVSRQAAEDQPPGCDGPIRLPPRSLSFQVDHNYRDESSVQARPLLGARHWTFDANGTWFSPSCSSHGPRLSWRQATCRRRPRLVRFRISDQKGRRSPGRRVDEGWLARQERARRREP